MGKPLQFLCYKCGAKRFTGYWIYLHGHDKWYPTCNPCTRNYVKKKGIVNLTPAEFKSYVQQRDV